jgi:bifunctional non-homologous end joining protein LigD
MASVEFQERKILGACLAFRCGGRQPTGLTDRRAGPSPEPHSRGWGLPCGSRPCDDSPRRRRDAILTDMLVVRADGFVDPCIPSLAHKPPSGPDWVHEVKHDGYRLIVRRDGDTVRLFTRRGYDWTERYPAIAGAAAKIRAQSFTLDGEAVVCGEDGVAIFDALHRHGTVRTAILQAFDLLELNGEDYRSQPLSNRKARLARLLGRAPAGIELNDHTDEDGATVFRHACAMGLEGIVSKRLSAPYRSGPSRDWIKVKNPDSPAMVRHREGRW